MRIVRLPGIRLRRAVDGLLLQFFEREDKKDFQTALKLISDFYKVKPPKVSFRRKIKNADGLCWEHGHIALYWPRSWRELDDGRVRSVALWKRTFYHEFAHYLMWFDDERKAETYADRFVHGISS